MPRKCPYLETGFNGEYRCRAISDNDAGYYTDNYLGDHPNEKCRGDYITCKQFKKKYAEGN